MQAWQTSHPPVRGSRWLFTKPMVHRGFLQAWQATGIQQHVLDAVKSILTTYPLPPNGRPWRLLVTGHSLGGALAQLAAYDISQLSCEVAFDVQCYTFGTPRIGNRPFARDYLAKVPKTFEIIHCDDLVCRSGESMPAGCAWQVALVTRALGGRYPLC